MKVIDPGYAYELAYFEKPDEIGQRLQFIKKEPIAEGSTELRTVRDGTTNEEVLTMLINRICFLDAKMPCEENKKALHCCIEALSWLQKRTLARQARGVGGTAEK